MGQVRPISEAEFTVQVIALAQLHRWLVTHFRPGRTAGGWRTAVSGDGKGFPDLVLVRRRVLWVELKTGRGKATPEQERWLDSLRQAGQEVYLWKPLAWEEIKKILE